MIAGTFGSALGVLFGIAMAHAMAGYIGGMLTDVYGVAQRADGLDLDPVADWRRRGDGHRHQPVRRRDPGARRGVASIP